MNQYLDLPLSSLRESPTNPRKHFDPAKLAELTKSVEAQGVVQPLVVRALDDGPEDYEIIAGARRFRAATAAGLQAVPCRIMQLDDRAALEVQQIENLQREDIHPLEEAAGYRVMLTQLQYTVADIAAKVGKDESYIYRRLKLTDLIPEAQEACWAETITPAMAALICRLTAADQVKALEATTGRGWIHTAKDLENWIDREIMLDLHKAAFPKDDATLLPGVGDCVSCPKRTGASPMLFPEIKRADTCTDGTCYKAKVAAFVERREEQLRAKDPELVKVSGNWNGYGSKAELPGREKYTELTAKEAKQREDAKKVLVVDGDKAGQTIHVVFDRGRSGGIQKTPAEKAAEARARAKEKLAAEIQRRQVFAIVDAVEAPLSEELLRFAVGRVWERIWNDLKRNILKRRGVDEIDIEALNHDQLAGLLVEVAMGGHSEYSEAQVAAAANLLGLELKPIADAARLEAKEEAVRKNKASTTFCYGNGCTRKVAAADKYCAEHMPANPAKPAKKAATKKKPAKKAAKKKGSK